MHAESLGDALRPLGREPHHRATSVHEFFARRRAACRPRSPSARPRASTSWTSTARTGVIRNVEHAYSKDGGLAVLYGNLAEDGCIVKTAGVDASDPDVHRPARVFESQDAAVDGILNGGVKAGDVVLIRYEGPRGGPGMQEMLYPTSYLKSKGLGKACALVTDGRFSGGSSGLSIGQSRPRRPRAADRPGAGRATASRSTSRTARSTSPSTTPNWPRAARRRPRRAGIRPSRASARSRRR